MKYSIITTLLLLTSTLIGQDAILETVKTTIKKLTLVEQNAFKSGDCETVLSLMDDNITFFANGRRAPSKEMIGRFCNNIPRPFQELNTGKLEVYALTESSGYVVRNFEYDKDEETKMIEVVTKIWRKSDDEWKMVHLHTTVKEVTRN